MHLRHCLALAAVAALAACGNRGTKTPGGGELTAEWLGADTGGVSTRPVANWCEGEKRLKITAAKGEVGIGVLIHFDGKIAAGSFTVFDAGVDSVRRPGAVFVGRWVNDKTVAAFQSDSGGLTLDSVATGLDGKFTVRMKGLNTSDTVRMTGHFGRLTLEGCGADSATSSRRPG